MAKRRDLKKNVNYIASELFAECAVQRLLFPNIDKIELDKLMTEVLAMHTEFISRISHTTPGNVKGFYKKFHSDFSNKVNEIIDGIEKLNK